MRLVFAGTPDFARVSLEALVESGRTPVATYTQPDRPAGRGKKLTASPVKRYALEHGIPVFQPATLRDDAAVEELRALRRGRNDGYQPHAHDGGPRLRPRVSQRRNRYR